LSPPFPGVLLIDSIYSEPDGSVHRRPIALASPPPPLPKAIRPPSLSFETPLSEDVPNLAHRRRPLTHFRMRIETPESEALCNNAALRIQIRFSFLEHPCRIIPLQSNYFPEVRKSIPPVPPDMTTILFPKGSLIPRFFFKNRLRSAPNLFFSTPFLVAI